LTETQPAWPPLQDVLRAAVLDEIDRSLAFLHDEKQLPRGQRKPNVGPAVREYLADQVAWLVVGMFSQAPTGTGEWGDAETHWTWGVRQPDGTPGQKGPIVGEETARIAAAEAFDVEGYRKVLLAREVGAWCEIEAGQQS
jgi:hypothetical protein